MLTYYYWPFQAGGAENQCRRLASQLMKDGLSCEVLTTRYDSSVASEDVDGLVPIRRKPTFETILQFLHIKSRGSYQKQDTAKSDEQIESEVSSSAEDTWKVKISPLLAALVNYGNVICFSTTALIHLFRHRNKIDILHVHTADWIAGLAAIAGSFLDIPVVCKGANIPVFSKLHHIPFPALFDRWRKRPHFIALTGAMEQDLQDNGIPEQRIAVIPNGVSIPEDQATPGDSNTFLYVGNFSQTAAHKGFDTLIEAWSLAVKRGIDARLVMLGAGDASPWKRLAEKLKCDTSIDFAGYQRDMAVYYKKGCCLLLPSWKEGISNAVLEAQSYGLPVIGSDIPGNRAVVAHEETGLIISPGNPEEFAHAIVRLYNGKDERCRFGMAARERMRQHFSMKIISTRTTSLYNQLIS